MEESTRPAPAGPPPQAQPAVVPPPIRKPRRAWMILLGVMGAVLAVVAVEMVMNAGHENTDDAQVEADVVAVASRVPGQILKIHAEDDQAVKKGDLLVELDPSDFQARLTQSEAELESAKAQATAADAQARVAEASATGGLSSARAVVSGSSGGVVSADAQIAVARAGLQRAQAEQQKAALDLKRAEELFAAGAVTQERLDNARLGATAAQAALAQAQAQVQAAEEGKRVARSRVEEATGRLNQSSPIQDQIAVAEANAALAHARVKSAEASLELAKLQLSYTKIVAPEDGVVSKLGAREGALVAAAQPLAQLVPQSTYVVANMKETQVGEVRPGDLAEITVDAYPGRKFEGRVESVSGGTGARFSLLPPDNASGNFVKVVQRVPVRIAWTTAPEVPMRAGLSADVTVLVGTHSSAAEPGGTVSKRSKP